jgi:peptide/nickel transport system substrate-binding protein
MESSAMTDEQTKTLDTIRKLISEGKLDRRKLMQTMAAMGIGTTAAAAGVAVRPAARAAAQDAPLLCTVSTQQQATWTRNFNPLLAQDNARWPTQSGFYEPMAVLNKINGELIPWLATEWSFSEDNTQITFKLNEGVTWADGEALDATDVAFTFNYLKQHEGLAGTEGVRNVIPLIASVEAPDATTVVFTFSEVNTPGLYDVAQQMIVPEHIWTEVADPVTFLNENPVGSGPFNRVGEFEDQYYEVLANESYWQEGMPKIAGFRFPAYPDNAAANLATVNGENDWAANFIPDIETTYVAEDPEHFTYWFPTTGSDVHLYVNTTKAPFNDPNVRKAISMAIDRPLICELAMFNYTHPADATGMSDAHNNWKDQAVIDAGTWVMQDVDAANALLDAAGLAMDGDVRKMADGTEMVYDLNVVTGWSDWVQACQIMAQNFEAIGFRVTVQPYDFSAWFDRVQKGEFDMSIGWSSQGATPLNFYRGVMASSSAHPVGTLSAENWHRFASEEVDALLKQFVSTSDTAEQAAVIVEVQKLYSEHAPAIPLFPGPQWNEFNTMRFKGQPTAENPYIIPSAYDNTGRLVQMTRLEYQDEATA